MIGKLKGIIDSIDENQLILDVAGVGYLVNVTAKTIAAIGEVGQAISLLIHMQVKEDDISLYGFNEKSEQKWFNNLITVQGIGPRLALTILSFLTPNELIFAINGRSKEEFKHISGVGPKLAERIFTELGKKASLESYAIPETGKNITQENNSNISDALNALTNLGYNRNEALNICKKIILENPEISINDLIRLALKNL